MFLLLPKKMITVYGFMHKLESVHVITQSGSCRVPMGQRILRLILQLGRGMTCSVAPVTSHALAACSFALLLPAPLPSCCLCLCPPATCAFVPLLLAPFPSCCLRLFLPAACAFAFLYTDCAFALLLPSPLPCCLRLCLPVSCAFALLLPAGTHR